MNIIQIIKYILKSLFIYFINKSTYYLALLTLYIVNCMPNIVRQVLCTTSFVLHLCTYYLQLRFIPASRRLLIYPYLFLLTFLPFFLFFFLIKSIFFLYFLIFLLFLSLLYLKFCMNLFFFNVFLF